MKKKNKKIYKKIITSVTSILMVLGIFVINRAEYKALSNVTTSNSYGGYTWQVIDTAFDMDGNVTLSSAQISMNLNGHYNGAFIINISLSTIIDSSGIGYTNTINNYGFICNGCIINGYDASHLYVSIYDCNYWEIQIIPIKNATIKNWKAILNAFDILSITGWSMTKLDEITATQITTIQNTLTSINSNISTTNSRLTTTNTELHNIYNSIGNSAQYGTIQTQLHGIAVNTTSMINEIQDIETHLSGYLTGTIDNQTVNIWDLQNDANFSLNNIENTLNTINNNINDYTTQLNSIQTTLSNIDTNLSNIDNTIDTITWKIKQNNLYVTNDFSTFVTTTGSYANTYYLTTQQFYVPDIISANDIIDIHTNVYLNPNGKIQLWYRNRAGTIDVNISDTILYENRNRFYIDVYFLINSTTETLQVNGTGYLYLKFDRNWNYYENSSQNSLRYISDNDIEYWQLLGFFEQYNSNIQILNAISNINMSVTNTTIQDTQTNITDYNTIYNQVSNVEQTYINEYNTNNTTLQSIINDKKGLPDNIVNVSTDIETKMGQIFQVPEFKYLFALILAGCVLLALLG